MVLKAISIIFVDIINLIDMLLQVSQGADYSFLIVFVVLFCWLIVALIRWLNRH